MEKNRGGRDSRLCITNWDKLVLQIGAAFFYYKLRKTLLQIGAASLLHIRPSVVTSWGSYYKLGQPLLQNRAAYTNWDKMYYRLGPVLQIRVIITNWGIYLYFQEISRKRDICYKICIFNLLAYFRN